MSTATHHMYRRCRPLHITCRRCRPLHITPCMHECSSSGSSLQLRLSLTPPMPESRLKILRRLSGIGGVSDRVLSSVLEWVRCNPEVLENAASHQQVCYFCYPLSAHSRPHMYASQAVSTAEADPISGVDRESLNRNRAVSTAEAMITRSAPLLLRQPKTLDCMRLTLVRAMIQTGEWSRFSS